METRLSQRLINILYKIVSLIFLVLAGLVFFIFILKNNQISMDRVEIPLITSNPIYQIIIFGVLFVLLIFMYPLLDKVKPKNVFLIGLTLMILAGLYLVFFTDTYLRGANPSSPQRVDPGSCVTIARHLNNHNYADFVPGGYMNMYPYQIYWISILRILLKINNSVTFLYFVMLLCALAAFWLIFKISEALFDKNAMVNIAVILATLFLPNLFNILFIYANLPAYVLFLLGTYLFVLSYKGKEKLIYLAALCFSAAGLLKSNFMIGIIAFFIVTILSHKKLYVKALTIILTLALIGTSNAVVNKYYSAVTSTPVRMNKGIPKSAFIMMGLNDNGIKDGWFDGSSIRLYQKYKYSTPKTNHAAIKQLKHRFKFFKTHRQYSKKYFRQKWTTTWSDPTFQSLWNAPMPSQGGRLKTPIMKSIYANHPTLMNRLIRKISWLVVLTTLLSSLLIVIAYICNQALLKPELLTYIVFSMLFFIGGFLFHTFWETKAQYVWQYVMTLIPVAPYSVNVLYKLANTRLLHRKDTK